MSTPEGRDTPTRKSKKTKSKKLASPAKKALSQSIPQTNDNCLEILQSLLNAKQKLRHHSIHSLNEPDIQLEDREIALQQLKTVFLENWNTHTATVKQKHSFFLLFGGCGIGKTCFLKHGPSLLKSKYLDETKSGEVSPQIAEAMKESLHIYLDFSNGDRLNQLDRQYDNPSFSLGIRIFARALYGSRTEEFENEILLNQLNIPHLAQVFSFSNVMSALQAFSNKPRVIFIAIDECQEVPTKKFKSLLHVLGSYMRSTSGRSQAHTNNHCVIPMIAGTTSVELQGAHYSNLRCVLPLLSLQSMERILRVALEFDNITGLLGGQENTKIFLSFVLTGVRVDEDTVIVKQSVRTLARTGIVYIIDNQLYLPFSILKALNDLHGVIEPSLLKNPGAPFYWQDLEELDAHLEVLLNNHLFLHEKKETASIAEIFREAQGDPQTLRYEVALSKMTLFVEEKKFIGKLFTHKRLIIDGKNLKLPNYSAVFKCCVDNPLVDCRSWRKSATPNMKPVMLVKQLKHTQKVTGPTIPFSDVEKWYHNVMDRMKTYQKDYLVIFVFITNREVSGIQKTFQALKHLLVIDKISIRTYFSKALSDNAALAEPQEDGSV